MGSVFRCFCLSEAEAADWQEVGKEGSEDQDGGGVIEAPAVGLKSAAEEHALRVKAEAALAVSLRQHQARSNLYSSRDSPSLSAPNCGDKLEGPNVRQSSNQPPDWKAPGGNPGKLGGLDFLEVALEWKFPYGILPKQSSKKFLQNPPNF